MNARETQIRALVAARAPQSQIDALRNQQQLDMVAIQALINKRQQNQELIGNVLAKFAQAQSQIIRNLG